ncbi:MAG TPA: glycosyltransferase [Cellvibrio sp.]|nr:glycosyltransferase [Cellvibrio sp.]
MATVNTNSTILHIISGDLWAGAEVQAYTLLKHLQPQVQLHVVLMNEGELANRLRALNITVTLLPETQLSAFAVLKKLVILIKELKPDVIHTHRQKENILGGIANVIAFPFAPNRPKSVRTTHGAPEFKVSGKQKLQVWLDSFVGKYLQQAVIAVSDDLAQKLSATFPVDHIHVVHNGVDAIALAASSTAADFKIALPEHKHIGIIGRIEPVKRVDIFIEMAALLLKQAVTSQPLFFHIIGDGRLRSDMEALVASFDSLGGAEYFRFHGHRNDMASCIASLDVIVMCSDHEGTPMTALEALALGTPLIAHDVGGLHELLFEYPEFLVQEHSPSAYAQCLGRYLTSEIPVPALSEKYKAETNAAEVLALYRDLVCGTPL